MQKIGDTKSKRLKQQKKKKKEMKGKENGDDADGHGERKGKK